MDVYQWPILCKDSASYAGSALAEVHAPAGCTVSQFAEAEFYRLYRPPSAQVGGDSVRQMLDIFLNDQPIRQPRPLNSISCSNGANETEHNGILDEISAVVEHKSCLPAGQSQHIAAS